LREGSERGPKGGERRVGGHVLPRAKEAVCVVWIGVGPHARGIYHKSYMVPIDPAIDNRSVCGSAFTNVAGCVALAT
jgi:hypothetical protein